MQTLLGAQLLSDQTLARIRTLNQFFAPASYGTSSAQINQSVLRGARGWVDSSPALAISRVLYPGKFLLSLSVGFNNRDTLQYVQLFDQSNTPVGGDVPIQALPVNPFQEWSWNPSQDGLIFEHACVIGISTTAATFTAGTATLWQRTEGLVL